MTFHLNSSPYAYLQSSLADVFKRCSRQPFPILRHSPALASCSLLGWVPSYVTHQPQIVTIVAAFLLPCVTKWTAVKYHWVWAKCTWGVFLIVIVLEKDKYIFLQFVMISWYWQGISCWNTPLMCISLLLMAWWWTDWCHLVSPNYF